MDGDNDPRSQKGSGRVQATTTRLSFGRLDHARGGRVQCAIRLPSEGEAAFSFYVAALKALLYRYLDQDTITVLLSPSQTVTTAVKASESFRNFASRVSEKLAGDVAGDDGPCANIACSTAPSKLLALDVLHFIFPSDPSRAAIEYDRTCFDDADVARLVGHYERLSRHALEHPETALDDLLLLAPEEAAETMRLGQGLIAPLPESATIHRLFEAQAQREPERVAAECARTHMTYRELNAAANRVAHGLIAGGMNQGDVVALLLERSCALLAGVLGVLKAGGVFLMVDGSTPSERMQWMLGEAGVRCVLTHGSCARPRLPSNLTVLDLARLEPADDAGPACPVSSNCGAYLIFTSGSSGRPKGVLARHSSLVNRMRWMQRAYGLGPEDVSLQRTALCFDPSICEMTRLLAVGGKVCFLPDREERNPESVIAWIRKHKVTIVDLVPSPLIALLEYVKAHGVAEDLASLRWVLAGAEALEPWVVRLFREVLSDRFATQLINGWGATEVTVDATWFNCTQTELRDRVPVGRPIDNTEAFLLSRAGRLMPRGMSGELHVAGACLASYWNSQEFNRERFIAVSELQDKSLYKTGDQARWLPDGNLEFLGRRDEQLKIRGVRIEPSEIEAVLAAHPRVMQAKVLARSSPSRPGGDLVAYVVAAQENGDMPDAKDLKAHLRQVLPDPMIPDFICVLERFPLNASEKIDVDHLPLADPIEATVSHDPLETRLARIWRHLLAAAPSSADDDFFDLGGHSLAATRLIARVTQEFGVKLALGDVYEHRTVRRLARHIRTLHPDERLGAIRPLGALPSYPASHAQKRIWLLSQFECASQAYNIPINLILPGRLDWGIFQWALDSIVRRHEILRTSFAALDGDVVQIVHDFQPGMANVSWVGPEEFGENRERAKEWIAAAHRAEFDLTGVPLLRAGVVELEDDESILFLTMHHIIADAWSATLIIRELLDCYHAARDRRLFLPPQPLPFHYKDYAVWQNERLEHAYGRQLKEFWKAELAGELPVLELPTDFPRPENKTYNGRSFAFVLGLELSAGLKRLGRANNASLFMVLCALLNALLFRYSGQEEIVLGTAVAGRDHPDTEDQLGCYVNTIALRMQCDACQTFTSLLRQSRDRCLRALEHQFYPFDLLVADLGGPRESNRSPLLDVMVVLQDAPGLDLGEAQDFDLDLSLGKLDLIFTFAEKGELVRADIQYNTDLFAPATIEAMARRLAMLCEGVIAYPERPLAGYDLLSPAEKGRWLERPSAACEPASLAMHHFFERQAATIPDQVALTFNERLITYRELNERANRLAHFLHYSGVGPHSIVAFLMERSERLVITELAILKLGAAFLPLDFSYPTDRIQFMLEDSGAKMLVAENRAILAGRGLGSVPALFLDDLDLRGHSCENPFSPVEPRDLAYVIYTSGSTGRPKGVLVEHRNIASLLSNIGGLPFRLRSDDVWTLFHSPAFDFSVWEIHVPLSLGARLVVIPSEIVLDPGQLAGLLQAQAVTILCQVPSGFHGLAAELEAKHRELALRYVIFGGETPLMKDLVRFRERYPAIALVNGYGITEATIFSTFKILGDEDLERGTAGMGEAISNQWVHLLDGDLKPVPDGIPGEIFIGGMSVTRGYLNRPEATAAHFLPDPAGGSGSVYRSGDLARRSSAGELFFLGRRDNQIKVRGFRVELDEVRSAMLELNEVRGCVAMVEDGTGSSSPQSITAYIEADKPIATGELRRQLARRLPEYMLPSRVVVLDAFPLTPNGKVDRRALAKIHPSAPIQETAPANPIEQQLAELWQEVLELKGIDANEDFFAIGGHSLRAVELASQIQRSLGVAVRVADIFRHPTIRSLAQLISGSTPQMLSTRMNPAAAKEHYEISATQRDFWRLEHFRVPGRANIVPQVYEFRDKLSVDAFGQAVCDVIDQFEILRTTFPLLGSEPRQKIHPPGCFQEAFRYTDLCSVQAETIQELYDRESQKSFDLGRGPLFRFHLARLAEGHFVALFSVHHIIWDGSSFEIFLEEFDRCYGRRAAGREPVPVHFPIQFKDFAEWHNRYMEGAEGQAALNRWTRRLQGFQPIAWPGRQKTDWSGCFYAHSRDLLLGRDETSALQQICRKESATLFMALQAALKAALFCYTGQTDITIGSPTAGRIAPDLEKQPGPFLNTLLLRDQVGASDTFRELLRRVKITALEAFVDELVPIDAIARALGMASSTSLLDAGLTLQTQAKDRRSADGAAWLRQPETFFGLAGALWVDAVEHTGELILRIAGNEGCFTKEGVHILAELIADTISRSAKQPDLPLEGIFFASERREVKALSIELEI